MGLIVNIHRDGFDSPLQIFRGAKRLTVVNVDGPFDPTPDAPAAMLIKRTIGHPAPVLVPVKDDGTPMTFVAMGGSYAATPDGRFGDAVGFYGAVAIHDWDLSRDTQTGA